jgi:hypothetical protein
MAETVPEAFEVRVSAGSLRADGAAFVVPHAWTAAGVAVEGGSTGGHLLHAAVAVCVLNDLFREARADEVPLDGVAVSARGGFGTDWASTGISYDVELDSEAGDEAEAALLARVEAVAEIPRAVRAGASVSRTAAEVAHG